MAEFARTAEGGVLLAVRLTPKASADAVVGEIASAQLSVKVRAMPEDGAANAALCKVVAKWLDVPKSSVSLASGGKSRNKTLLIEGEPRVLLNAIAAAAALLKSEKI